MRFREEILQHIRLHAVTCIQGETGCGKSTRVPYFLLQEERERETRRREAQQQQPKQQQLLQSRSGRRLAGQQQQQLPRRSLKKKERGGGGGDKRGEQEDEDEAQATAGAPLLEGEEGAGRLNVIVTQPRRLACIALARRVAQEAGEPVGRSVGFRIGGDSNCSSQTKICFMTTGYLMQLLTHAPHVLRDSLTHIILDEVHERSIEADLLSLIIKLLLLDRSPHSRSSRSGNNGGGDGGRKARAAAAAAGDDARSAEAKKKDKGSRRPPKLVVMSATMQGNLFAEYFTAAGCPPPATIFVGAKRFPVQQLYLEDLLLLPSRLPGRRLRPHELAGDAPLQPLQRSTSNSSSSKKERAERERAGHSEQVLARASAAAAAAEAEEEEEEEEEGRSNKGSAAAGEEKEEEERHAETEGINIVPALLERRGYASEGLLLETSSLSAVHA
ncbi:UNVERIFIED_CONTAM: hypothetical protein H355_003862, partial [Colinus virginianus]